MPWEMVITSPGPVAAVARSMALAMSADVRPLVTVLSAAAWAMPLSPPPSASAAMIPSTWSPWWASHGAACGMATPGDDARSMSGWSVSKPESITTTRTF